LKVINISTKVAAVLPADKASFLSGLFGLKSDYTVHVMATREHGAQHFFLGGQTFDREAETAETVVIQPMMLMR
jgi:hypothetical protein